MIPPNSPSREAAEKIAHKYVPQVRLGLGYEAFVSEIVAALTSARLQEREECAKVADVVQQAYRQKMQVEAQAAGHEWSACWENYASKAQALEEAAAAIRSRTEKEDGNG